MISRSKHALNVKFWNLKFTHRGYPAPKSLMLIITPYQPYLDLSDKNAFAELDSVLSIKSGDKMNAEIFRYYQHLFKYPSTPFHKSSTDCAEELLFVFYDRWAYLSIM